MTTQSTAAPVTADDAASTAAVHFCVLDGVAVATISRPQTRNALSSEVLVGIADACRRATADGACALVLTSQGKTFCSGGDLASVVACLDGDVDAELGRMVDELHTAVAALRSLEMPVVVAVNGPAIGAGISIAMAGDVRILNSSAFFLSGYIGVGASPDGGASFHLARALGESQALAAFLLNRRITADTLAARGLVDEVVPDDEVLDAALRLAHQLGELSFPAVQAMRDLVFSASVHTLDEHLEAEKERFLAIARTPQFRAGVAPFGRLATPATS